MDKIISDILKTAQELAEKSTVALLWQGVCYPAKANPKTLAAWLQRLEKNPQVQSEKNELAAPLVWHEQVAGVLLLTSPAPFLPAHTVALGALATQFSQNQEDRNRQVLLQEFTNLVSSSIDWNSSLPKIAQLLANLGQADACSITLWDHGTRRPQEIARWKQSPQTPTDSLGQSQQQLTLPLVWQGQSIGSVFLWRQSASAHIVETLQPALDHLALAIENQRLHAETQSRLQESNTLLEIAAIAATTSDFKTLLKQVLELCRQVIQVEAGAILLLDRDAEHLQYLSGSGAFGFVHESRHLNVSLQQKNHIVTAILRQGQPIFYNSKAEIPANWHPLLQSGEVRNILLAPIGVQDQAVGVFIVANKQGDFNFNDAGLLLAMSSHVAAVVRNSELLQDTRERLSETEILQRIAAITSANLDLQEMLSTSIEEITQLFHAEGVQLLTLGPNGHSLVASSRAGLYADEPKTLWEFGEDTPEMQVFQSQTPYLGPYTAPYEAYYALIVPAKTQQGVMGTLSILRASHPFRQSDLAIAIASQIAIGMQSHWLFAQERQRADLMLLINRIAQELSATLDLRNLMRKVVTNLHDTLGYEIVYIFLLDENGDKLICQASITSQPQHHLEVGFSTPLEVGLVGLVVRERQTLLLNDIQNHPNYFRAEGHSDIKSGLLVPLKHGNNVYGVMEILSTEEKAFNETDQMAMESLSSQVSIAIDNARLYNQAQRRLLEQGIVHQIGQDLTAILSYNELVQAVVRHMTRALDTSSCTVALYDEERERIRVEATYHLPGTEKGENLLKVGNFYNLPKFHAMRQALQSRRAVTAYQNHPESDPKHVMQLQQDHARSELILPMLIGKRIIGLVRWAENRRDRRFSREDERLAQVLISQAAIAIENARLFREAERRAHEQYMLSQVTISLTAATSMDELLQSFTIQTHNALEASNTLVALTDSEGQWVIRDQILTSRQVGETVIGQMLNNPSQGKQIRLTLMKGNSLFTSPGSITQTPAQLELALIIRDHTAVALAPIMYRGSLVGMVEVSADAPSTIDKDGMGLLESLANQVAIAIDNLRLSQREQQRLKRMERLQISSRLITSELVKENLLKTAAKEAAAIFESTAVAILLPDAYNTNYVIQAAQGLSETFVANYYLSIKLRTADVEAMSETQRRRPRYYSQNAMLEQLSEAQTQLIKEERIASVLSVPLVKGTKIAGLLALYSQETAYRFQDEEVDLAQLFASQIAVALDNADLFLAAEERARELAEANRLKSQFLANISHELRTPMNSILGFSETILSGLYGEVNEKQASRIERIWHNGKNLRALIDDLLDLSKIDAGRMELYLEPLNLVELIQSVLQTLESQVQSKQIGMDFVYPTENFPLAYADAIRIRQIATNLIGNAIKFTKEGGVTIELSHKTELILSPKEGEMPEQEVIWVSIQDTGIGISLEDQLIIFDEFRQVDGSTTREYGGTGLGLAICKRLIEMMGGRIWVDSEKEKGSRFTFVVPVAAPDAVKQLLVAESI